MRIQRKSRKRTNVRKKGQIFGQIAETHKVLCIGVKSRIAEPRVHEPVRETRREGEPDSRSDKPTTGSRGIIPAMTPAINTDHVRGAEVVLPCSDLDATVAFFREQLGFRIDAIFPADDPAVAAMSGHGMRLRLERGGANANAEHATLRLLCDDPAAAANGQAELRAPNGCRVLIVPAEEPVRLPPVLPSLVINRLGQESEWVLGRAGMRYRDLVPDRQGGMFIASHIHIPDAGPVPDYVHYHRVRFQMIYCYRGWVKVAYEDQGEPFVMHAGDCVLQPPQIRHRVLECSADLHVVEIGCPADHETRAEHEIDLPNREGDPSRQWDGQRFIRHIAAEASWQPWRINGLEARDVGIGAATNGVAGVQVARVASGANAAGGSGQMMVHNAEFRFVFVLDGSLTLTTAEHGEQRLATADSFVVPAGMPHALGNWSPDLQLLEVALPASFELRPA